MTDVRKYGLAAFAAGVPTVVAVYFDVAWLAALFGIATGLYLCRLSDASDAGIIRAR